MEISVLNYKDYKRFLKDVVTSSKAQRGMITKMATAAECQPSYLSQVLGSHVQITPEQALGISEFLNLSNLELEYFVLLVDHARAGSSKLKKRLENKLELLKKQNEDLSERLQRPSLHINEAHTVYYSNWIWVALHVLVAIPQFQETGGLSKKLGLPQEVLFYYLEKLEQMGFVKRESGLWKHSGVEVHLPKNSPLISLHHNNWRQLAVLKSQQHRESDIHFTGVYALSAEDLEKIKEMILKNISSVTKVASASPPGKVVCFNYDFFEI